jgi:putative addiction module killer protein
MEVFASYDYLSWINDLKDRAGRSRVLIRVDRLIHGNPGLHRNLTEGMSELKIDVGPCYRVCYSFRGDKLLLLLGGGKSQLRIKILKRPWNSTVYSRTSPNDSNTVTCEF